MLGNSAEEETPAELSCARSFLADARENIYRSFLCGALWNGVERKRQRFDLCCTAETKRARRKRLHFSHGSTPDIFLPTRNERQRCRFVSVLYRKNGGQSTGVLRSAKCFSLVSDARCCVASPSLRNGKRNEIGNSLTRGHDMTMHVRLNALAAALSFGFVMAVVLGMI
jgi:hypothetical protein